MRQRKYGVHSAMPLAKSIGCSAVFLPVNMDKYIKASDEIMQIFHKWTPLVEAISLDEAFLDITNSKMLFGDVCKIGAMIKQEIVDKVHLTLSVGIASNKFVAKIASDLHKPDGFTVVEKGKEMEFLKDLPIGKLWGVGKVTEIQLTNLGISTIGELAVYSVEKLAKKFGKQGESLHKLSLGIDESPVIACYEPKSIGRETTFQFDTADIEN